MTNRWLVLCGASLLTALLCVLPTRLSARPAPVPVIDLHVDLSYGSLYKQRPFDEGVGQFRARDLVQGGLAGVVLPLFVPGDAEPKGRTLAEFERSYAWVFGRILETPPYSLFGCGVSRAGGQARSVETWLAFEGSGPLPDDVAGLRPWVLRGVRVFGIVHSEHNDLATSSGEPAAGKGLSPRGQRFVRAVFALQALIDVSHSSDQTVQDVLEIAKDAGGTVIATHSNARRLAHHPRNLTDEQIAAIGRSGGVVGVNFHQTFLDPRKRSASVAEVARVMEHIARVAGDEAVAIGSDFEGGIRPPAGLESALGYQNLAQELRRRGVDEVKVRGYFSGNARRVLCPR